MAPQHSTLERQTTRPDSTNSLPICAEPARNTESLRDAAALGYDSSRTSLNRVFALSDEISERLKKHGIKPTAQRLEIARLLLPDPCHLSAEQVIARLRADGSRVSKATVYNTLKLFCRHGILREIAVDPSRMFYDSMTAPHHHFYNEDTGELIDIDPSQLRIASMPSLPKGTIEQSRDLVVRVRNRSQG